MKFQFTYYAFSCNLLVFLFPVLKILFTGMLAVIHFPSQLETFLLIFLASQPCKIPCYKFFFFLNHIHLIIVDFFRSLAVKGCLATSI